MGVYPHYVNVVLGRDLLHLLLQLVPDTEGGRGAADILVDIDIDIDNIVIMIMIVIVI